MLFLFLNFREPTISLFSHVCLQFGHFVLQPGLVRLQLIVELHDQIDVCFLLSQRLLHLFVLIGGESLVFKQFVLQSALHFIVFSTHLLSDPLIFFIELFELMLKIYNGSCLFGLLFFICR